MKLLIGLIALIIATIGGGCIGYSIRALRDITGSGITYGQLVDGLTAAVVAETPIGEKVFHCICDLDGGCVMDNGDIECTEEKIKNCAMRWIGKGVTDEN